MAYEPNDDLLTDEPGLANGELADEASVVDAPKRAALPYSCLLYTSPSPRDS